MKKKTKHEFEYDRFLENAEQPNMILADALYILSHES